MRSCFRRLNWLALLLALTLAPRIGLATWRGDHHCSWRDDCDHEAGCDHNDDGHCDLDDGCDHDHDGDCDRHDGCDTDGDRDCDDDDGCDYDHDGDCDDDDGCDHDHDGDCDHADGCDHDDDGDCDHDDDCPPTSGCGAPGTACPDDGNPCTDDVCGANGTCGVANTASCDDGQFCNGADTCGAGSCSVHAGSPCGSGGECADTCNEATDTCFDPAGTACTSDENLCTDDRCDGAGNCTHTNNTAPCEDGVFCNGADKCSAGSCSSHRGDPCAGGSDCADTCNEAAGNCFDAAGAACASDNNVCTDDQCSGSGTCLHGNNAKPCDDGKFCTVNDTCGGGSCKGSTRDCSDSNTCTNDSCSETNDQCVHAVAAGQGTPCDDNDVCTLNTTCDATGACANGAALNCGDGIDCTNDICQPITGCHHVALTDARNCVDSCSDGIDNDNDGNVDSEDEGCSTLAAVQRFAVVSTHDTNRKAVYTGSDVTVEAVEADGTCNLDAGRCECAARGPLNCPSRNLACTTDIDCRTGVAGTCNTSINECQCPANAPNCQAKGRLCSQTADCGIAPYPHGNSYAGVCGYSMEIRAGGHFGFISSNGDLSFGKGSSVERHLNLQQELSTSGGEIETKQLAPLVGPTVCSSQLDLVCNDTTICPAAPSDVCDHGQCTGHEEACLSDVDCAAACDARRRTDDGTCKNNPAQHCTLDAECGGANTCDHPFVFTDASSDEWQRCDELLQLASGGNAGVSEQLRNLANAIAAYAPAASERVPFPAACEACPTATTPSGDPSCVVCPSPDQIKANSDLQKYTVTVGGGLQILDLVRVKVPGLMQLHLLGQDNTVLVVRLAKGLRLGSEAQIILGSNGTDNGSLRAENILWNLAGKSGGGPDLARQSRFFGTILAPERPGIRTGSGALIDGALLSHAIHLEQTTDILHVPFTPLLPVGP